MSSPTVARRAKRPQASLSSAPDLAERLAVLSALCRGFRLTRGHSGVTAVLCDRMEEELEALGVFPALIADLEAEYLA